MKEEINEIFFKEKENNVEKRKTFNQSIELLQTEDIFIDQKEEIKRIKKKRLEIKNYNQNKTNFINMKYIKNRRKKFNTLNNLNLTEDIKNKNKGNLQDIDKKAKQLNKNDKNIKTLKLKFFPDNSNNINENKENIKSENEINENNDIKSNINSNNNDEENTIINNDNEIMLSTEKEIDYISLININHFQKCDCILNEKYFNNYCYDDVNAYDEIPKITGKWINLNNINNININKINLSSKNKLELKNPPLLIHSGSQRLIIKDPNRRYKNNNLNININGPKKILHKNASSELPSLNIINHLNEIYKIYAPYLKKPQVKNNIKYKPYNNNYYLKNIQRYYKIGNVNNKNNYNYNGNNININQINSNRIGSGRKILPNRKLSPLKRNIINIC